MCGRNGFSDFGDRFLNDPERGEERRREVEELGRAHREEEVDEERGYRAARERSLGRLREGFDLGTGGRATWKREQLHDR